MINAVHDDEPLMLHDLIDDPVRASGSLVAACGSAGPPADSAALASRAAGLVAQSACRFVRKQHRRRSSRRARLVTTHPCMHSARPADRGT